MDTRRLILFIVLALGLMFVWEKYFAPKPPVTQVEKTAAINPQANIGAQLESDNFLSDQVIHVATPLVSASINTVGGDLRGLKLLKYNDYTHESEPYSLLTNKNKHIFVAQTGVISNDPNLELPTHKTTFRTSQSSYNLVNNESEIKVSLTATTDNGGILVIKTYTFKNDSYVIDVNYQIINNTDKPLDSVSIYWRFLRDEVSPEGSMKFIHTFAGPVYYNSSAKFNTIKFEDLNKGEANYPKSTADGWVGFTEHYFSSLWLLNPYNRALICNNSVSCQFNFKSLPNGLASSGVITSLPVINSHSHYSITVPMFVGPQEYQALANAAPELERTKDYGWVYIFATPLFWLLIHIFELVKNWGWAIVLLTVLVKIVLYPLTRASYQSMAKMKALAPKMEQLKSMFADDKTKLQQAMMKLYREEKVNPIGGCLPMLLQVPVFIGLYWALLGSVELRQAHFLWINDLSRPDPYFILPAILAVTMFMQTFLNPPAADPVQAKMMRIMPIAFSIMFFFFPAGLVVYWLVNNILSMAQQWYVNNHVVLKKKK